MAKDSEYMPRVLNVEKCAEILEELVSDNGKIVHSLSWDSGAPGPGAGVELIFEFRGMYWAQPSDDAMHGPYDSLEEALDEPFVWITKATEAIQTKLPLKALLPRLMVHDDVGHRFTINGTFYEIGPGCTLLRRVKQPARKRSRR